MPNIIEITDFHAPELDIYARYTEGQLLNRHEPEKGIFIAESPKVIERALDSGCQPISFLVEDRQAEHQAKEIIRRCDQICKNIPVFTAPFEVLTELTGFKLTRGLLCAMHRPPHPSVEQVCQNARRVAVLAHHVAPPVTVGKCGKSYQCGGHFPFGGSLEYGCSAVDRRMQRSAVPQGGPGQYGDGVPGAMDLFKTGDRPDRAAS